MVKAKIICQYGQTEIFIQRAKFKWWFIYGSHKATDYAFKDALAKNEVGWQLIEPKTTLL